MKKIILVLLLVLGSLYAGKLSKDQEDTAKLIITSYGYSCSKVDMAVRLWDGGISTYCDGYSYNYVIKNIGGKLQVEVK